MGSGGGGSRGRCGSLAPITLLGGRRLGDDAHAGGAATHVAATGGTEAPAATAIGEAAAVAAPAHTEAAAPAVACASRGGDHGCREKARGTLAVSAGFPRPTLPGSGVHGTSLGNRNLLSPPGAGSEGGHVLPIPIARCSTGASVQDIAPFKGLHSCDHTVSIGLRGHYYYEHPHFTKEKLEAQRDQVASPRSPLLETKVLGSHAVFTPHLHQGLSLSEGPTL